MGGADVDHLHREDRVRSIRGGGDVRTYVLTADGWSGTIAAVASRAARRAGAEIETLGTGAGNILAKLAD
jgi:hypothetical protein